MASSSSTVIGARAQHGVDVAVALADDLHLGVAAGGEFPGIIRGGQEDRQFLDLHGDEVGRVLRHVGVFGKHRRDRLADVAHLVGREHRLAVGLERGMRPSRKSIGGTSVMSAAVQTATTPGKARAADVSIDMIRPCAWFERTTRRQTWCGKEISAAKRPRPLTSGGSSSRSTDCPIHLLLPAAISERSALHAPLRAFWPRRREPPSRYWRSRCSGRDWRRGRRAYPRR